MFGVVWLGRTQLRKNTVTRRGPSDHAPPRTILYLAGFRTARVLCGTGFVVGAIEPIVDPLGYVARHVENAEGVRLEFPDGTGTVGTC